jgi:DNA polymerase III delta prime subunit
MNENIVNTLEQYVKDVNPQYAILLSGSWGCGKTYFIDAWIEKYNEQKKNKEITEKSSKSQKPIIDLKPIKVSLFGLQTKLEFIEILNKELSPFLFNLKKCGLVVAKVVSRVALKSDIIKEVQSPIEVEFSALETLLQGNENVSIKGEKLIILDDVERCRIPTVELFGLIDLLLHKYLCKIIIIGDETHLKNAGETEYTQYKEKIIGQTLVVQKDSNAAFEVFAQEIEKISTKAADFVRGNKECVLEYV